MKEERKRREKENEKKIHFLGMWDRVLYKCVLISLIIIIFQHKYSLDSGSKGRIDKGVHIHEGAWSMHYSNNNV